MSKQTEAGFTLMEVLIALVILAIAAAYAFRIAAGGFAWLSQAAKEQEAVSAAETAFSHLGHDVPLQPGRITDGNGRMHWVLDIGAALADPAPAQGFAAYPVAIDVQWLNGGTVHHYQMRSVRLGPEPATQ